MLNNTQVADHLSDFFGGDYFTKNYWTRQPLLLTDKKWELNSLISITEIDRLITESRFTDKDIRLGKDGSTIPAYEYLDYVKGEGVVNPAKILHQYRNGASIILNRLNNHNYALAELCRLFDKKMKILKECYTNIYITPPNSYSFPPHYDEQDVVVLQIEGEKQWKVFNPIVENPLEEQMYQDVAKTDYASDQVMNVTLAKDDILYVPRGFVHEVNTTDEPSIHITLTIIPYTWYDICQSTLKFAMANDAELRSAVPVDIFDGFNDHLKHYRDRIQSFSAVKNLEKALNSINISRNTSGKPMVKGLFETLYNKTSLKEGVTIFNRSSNKVSLKTKDEELFLNFNSRTIKMPASVMIFYKPNYFLC
ncbi:JmjC domain-containing protein, partial [Fulvivirga imtechensis]|uniref:JmjC domain-containing protein n=1 Tax=Fulvivirga imtechensis TaxID=881893 RepID=UPI00058CF320